MKVIWDIFSGDVRNLFRNVIAAIVVMGLALVPPMYAWFTTLGFWDPYSNTGNIKVAVASEDAGYTSDLIPTPINAGEQIIGKLRANDQFAWQFVSADEAARGVRSGEYYAALVIPKEFSRDLMTVFTDDITEPRIIYYDNEKENAIAQRVTATGASTLQETIDETFTETVASVALGTTSSLTSFMSGDGILTYAQTLGSRLGEAVGEVGAAADQAQAYADLMSSTTSLVDATASILKEAGKAPDATAPLVSETRDGLTSAQDGLSAASTAAEKALTTADASYDAVARAADEGLRGKADCPDQRLPHAPAHDFFGRIFLIAARACQQKRNVADVEGVEQEPVKAAARDLPFSDFKPARGNDGKADQAADDAGGDQIVLKQFDFCAQQGADEQHQRKEAKKDEIFKTASHDKTPSLRLTRAFECAEPMRALSGRLCLQAVFHKKRINKFHLLCVKDLPKSVICHYTETKQYHTVFINF